MYIYELDFGSPITITCKMKHTNQLEWKKAIFKTNAKKKQLIVEPLTHSGKIVSFKGIQGLIIEVTAQGTEGPIIFKNCSITTLMENGRKFHAITCLIESSKTNRRQCARTYINERCSVEFLEHRMKMVGVLKDLSASGFSCVINPKDDPRTDLQGDYLSVSYTDSVIGKPLFLNGKIVRRVSNPDYIMYGVHMGNNLEVEKLLSVRAIS